MQHLLKQVILGGSAGLYLDDRSSVDDYTAFVQNRQFYVYNNSTSVSLLNVKRDGTTGLMTAGTQETSPTAFWHLRAGTSTATQAPLKFTAGTNLATTEAGAIEFDGTHLYFTATNAGTRYQLDQQTGATPTLQQVLTAGPNLSSSHTIDVAANLLDITGSANPVNISTTSGASPALDIYNFTSTNNDVIDIFRVGRASSTTVADGFGVRQTFSLESASGANQESNNLISKWTTAANATRTSRFAIQGVVNGISGELLGIGDYVTLTESSATIFTSTTLATGTIQGGTILVTVEANDATDFQSRTLRFIWSAVNKAGNLFISVSTPEEVVAVSSGTLTVSITLVNAGGGVLDFKANAVSSLTQSTLRATYQTFKNF